MEKLVLRHETEVDLNAIFLLNKAVFDTESEARLVDALRKNSSVFLPELSIIATLRNQIIGHILFTKILIKGELGNQFESLALAPMAVFSEFQNKGVGGQLINHGLEVAKHLGFKSVIVLGHEKYYPKFGFEPAQKWGIKAPFEVPSNAFMAIELVKDGLKEMAGEVSYPNEFSAVT
ncbi:MAG TPA: N-acetyltransferase [Saprospiraceae bacterium]|nr:N-acetyltransferase [Saprospiraceae bacterium]